MHGYQVLEKLSDGSAAEVFLAREESTRQRVILEMLRPELTRDMDIYGRFLDAAKQRQDFAHPSVLRRAARCADDGRIFAVSEPIGAKQLRGVIFAKDGPIPWSTVVRLIAPVCDALGYLHEHGVVHNNLRPSQVLLVDQPERGTPKLLDTGLSLFRSSRSIVTPAERVLVNPSYLSPERVRGQRGDSLSDVYGLGVLIYEVITGHPPFHGPDPAKVRAAHLKETPAPLPPGYEEIAAIVSRCLAKAPADRFPSAAAVAQALRSVPDCPTPRPRVTQVIGERRPAVKAPAAVPGIGDVLGSYQLEALLGEGGMGRVFLARHGRLGRKVALKVLRSELSADPEHLRRFFGEARAVNQISHEHIVEIYDFVEAAGGPAYCVMEALEGTSLRVLARQPLPLARAIRIVRQVCGALAAAHQAGIVHRDIKPDNIFITPRGADPDFVKVLDFGVAKLGVKVRNDGGDLTASGVVVGTRAYMAPEQALGESVDHRADIYALAGVLYELLYGKPSFRAGILTVGSPLAGQPPELFAETTRGGEPVPQALAELVGICLNLSPSARVQSMAKLSAALAPFESGAPASRKLPRRAIFAGAGLAAVLLCAGMGIAFHHPAAPVPAPPVLLPVIASPAAPESPGVPPIEVEVSDVRVHVQPARQAPHKKPNGKGTRSHRQRP